MDLTTKKELFMKKLEENGFLKIFNIKDKGDYILLQTDFKMNGGNCFINVVLRDGIHDTVYFNIGELNNEDKRVEMLELLNEFNRKDRDMRFYIEDDNRIVAEVTYMSDTQFEAELFEFLVIANIKYIEEEYHSKIMKVIWS